jgi:hypothetical protein
MSGIRSGVYDCEGKLIGEKDVPRIGRVNLSLVNAPGVVGIGVGLENWI